MCLLCVVQQVPLPKSSKGVSAGVADTPAPASAPSSSTSPPQGATLPNKKEQKQAKKAEKKGG